MASVKVPRDLNQFEERIIGPFTKRQALCFLGAGLTALPIYFAIKDFVPLEISLTALSIVAFPWMMAAWYKRDGITAERYLLLIYRHKFWQVRIRKKGGKRAHKLSKETSSSKQ